MATWRRDERPNDIALAAVVPDAIAVLDDAGGIAAWDESAAHEYALEVGLPSDCDDGCAARGHIVGL